MKDQVDYDGVYLRGAHLKLTNLLNEKQMPCKYYIFAVESDMALENRGILQTGYDNRKDNAAFTRKLFVGVIALKDALVNKPIFVHIKMTPGVDPVQDGEIIFDSKFPPLPTDLQERGYNTFNLWTDGNNNLDLTHLDSDRLHRRLKSGLLKHFAQLTKEKTDALRSK